MRDAKVKSQETGIKTGYVNRESEVLEIGNRSEKRDARNRKKIRHFQVLKMFDNFFIA
jgi:hypothetical protein